MKRLISHLVTLVLMTGALGACAKSGGYFEDDGPPMFSSADGYQNAPNAVVKLEPPKKAANRPYTVAGKRYYPMTGDAPLTQTGMASWYGKKFHGKKTSTGEVYNMYAMTAAHPTMELPSYARVTNLANGRSIIVRVNDRGPFLNNRIIDLSYAAASKLGYVKNGTALVKVERITRAQIASGRVPSSIRLGEVDIVRVQKDLKADAIAIESVIAQMRKSMPETSAEHFGAAATETDATDRITIEDAINMAKPFEKSDTLAIAPEPEKPVDTIEALMQEPTQEVSIIGGSTPPAAPLFYKQAGVFSSKENAKRVATELLGEMNEPIEIYEDAGRYRVLVGRGATKAQVLEDIAREKGHIQFVPFEK